MANPQKKSTATGKPPQASDPASSRASFVALYAIASVALYAASYAAIDWINHLPAFSPEDTKDLAWRPMKYQLLALLLVPAITRYFFARQAKKAGDSRALRNLNIAAAIFYGIPLMILIFAIFVVITG